MTGSTPKYICSLISVIFLLFAGGHAAAGVAEAPETKRSMRLTDSERAWLAEHRTIRVAFDGFFPPYSFLNEYGKFEGLAVDVMQVLAERIGVTIEPSPKAVWKDLFEAAKRREVDVVATMGRQPEREEWFAFTRPYIFKSLVIMTRDKTTAISRPADLAGKRVALVTEYQYVKPLLEKYPAIKPYPVDTMLDGLNAVAIGKADAAITFLGAGHYLQTKYQIANLKFVAVFERDRFRESIAVRKDWPELTAILDKALGSITGDEMAVLSRRWVGPEYAPGIAPRTVIKYVVVVVGIALFLVSGFTIWNRALKRQISQKTEEVRQEFAERKKTEDRLQDSERFVRDIFDSLLVNIAVVDRSGVVLKVNRAWEDFARENSEGKTVRACAGDNYFEVCRKAKGRFSDEAAEALRGFEAVLAGHIDHFDLEYPCHSAAEKRWFLLRAVSLQTQAGGLVVSHTNISKWKEAGEALLEKEHLLSESQRIAHIGSWSLQLGASRIAWSAEMYHIYGISPETFVPTAESFIQLIHPDDRAAMQAWIGSCAKGERPGDLEFRAVHPDGTVRVMTGRGDLQYDAENRPVRMMGTVQDITSLKQAETALRRSEEKFFTTFRNSPDAIMLTSLPDGKLVEANERFMRISGYSPEQIFGHSSLELNIWADPAERQHYFELLQAHGSVSNMEADYRMKSGEILNGMISGEIIEVQGSKYILSVVRDITGRKQAELELKKYRDSLEELVKERTAALQDSQRALVNIVEDLNQKTAELKSANDKLKELDRLKSMFIASMSHELRTPLNSIIGFTGIILQGMTGEITEEQRDQLQRVSRAGKHLLALITDVIDISKIEAGKIDVSVEEFSLGALLNEAAAALKPQISEKGLDLEVRTVLRDVVMKTDRKRLFQSVLNYLSNAVKFTEKGKIILAAEKTGGMIEIRVADTGIGIQSQELSRLFQSFVRLDTPPGISTAGTGLGLYLTKKLVTEVLGGSVSVISRSGEGSTFSMKIPMRI